MGTLVKEYKGFTIQLTVITEGKSKYMGLVARSRGIRIESPRHENNNRVNLCRTIDQFINSKK